MKLYSYWRSTAAYRVRIVLNLKGINYHTASINLLENEQAGAAYRTLNPEGLVPALEVDSQLLTQSTAIIEYLEERYPTPPLLPANIFDRAKVRGICQAIACDIHPLNNLRVQQYLRSDMACNNEQVDRWYKNWIEAGFSSLESRAASHDFTYLCANDVTLADVYLVPQVYNAKRFNCDLTPYPTIDAITNRLQKLAEFSMAAPDQQPDAVLA